MHRASAPQPGLCHRRCRLRRLRVPCHPRRRQSREAAQTAREPPHGHLPRCPGLRSMSVPAAIASLASARDWTWQMAIAFARLIGSMNGVGSPKESMAAAGFRSSASSSRFGCFAMLQVMNPTPNRVPRPASRIKLASQPLCVTITAAQDTQPSRVTYCRGQRCVSDKIHWCKKHRMSDPEPFGQGRLDQHGSLGRGLMN